MMLTSSVCARGETNTITSSQFLTFWLHKPNVMHKPFDADSFRCSTLFSREDGVLYCRFES